MHDVVVVGSGPTGLVLGAELRLAGLDPLLLERRETKELAGSRAGGFHARTLELLDQRGIVQRFLDEGDAVQVVTFGGRVLDLAGFPTRFPYSLGLWQNHIERLLQDWAEELGVRVERGVEVTGLTQDDDAVEVLTSRGPRRAQYVVGADGGRSVVRKAAGIGFEGWEATRTHLIAEVELAEEFPVGIHRDDLGIHGLSHLADGRTVRVMVTEEGLGGPEEPTLADLAQAIARVWGRDFGPHRPTWISRFSDATRQATAYRAGRVLVAGDAAHTHHPSTGQGIGLGVQDAVNLGWKLAQVVRGTSPAELLDSYHAERHPADARALQVTMAQSVLQRQDPRVGALRDVVDDLLGHAEASTPLAARIAGLDVTYETGDHPLVGRRVPDLDLPDGPLYRHLHAARPVLLELGGPPLDGALRTTYAGPWVLPVLGEVRAPTGVLIRPDGHVAWVGEGTDAGLAEVRRALGWSA